MFEKFKLSTSQMILLALFVLIVVIALFGYLEFNKMDSKLERLSYSISKINPNQGDAIVSEMLQQQQQQQQQQQIHPEEQQQIKEIVEKENYDDYDSESDSGSGSDSGSDTKKQGVIKIEDIENDEKLKKDLFNLTEAKQEFTEEVPEEQSAFSLGSIFGNQIPDGKENPTSNNPEKKTDKIDEDSEYSDEGSYSDDSEPEEEPIKLTKGDLEKMSLTDLKKKCEELKIAKYGNKNKLIEKIFKKL
jgi:hypothetical protein